MQAQATKRVHEANELPEEIEDFKDWLSDQEGESYSEDDIADWGWDYVKDRVEYPNGVKTHYTTYTTKYRGSKYTCEVAWDNFNEVIQGSEVWQGDPESKKTAESVNLLNKAKTATEAQAGVSPYLTDIAHKLLMSEYGWGAATREEVSSWLAEHKKAFERGYGQSLRMYDDDKINVRAGIDAILNEEEGAVTAAEISMMESGPKEWFGKDDIVQALANALHNEDEAYVIRFLEGTPGYAYAYNKNGYDSWKVYADGTVEWEFDGTYQGNKKISSLARLPRAMKDLCNFLDEDHEIPQSAAWTPEIKKIKDLKKGDMFTLKPIEYPKESQVWSLEGYDRSTRKYWAGRWSDISDSREFKGDKEVYTGFTF